MGTDNLHHKRKAKVTRELGRRRARRDSYDKILIVCEGEKTEPNYFRELVNFYKLNSANVERDRSCGSSPKSVLERAEELALSESNKGDAYDRVYCVFDKDSHETYDETIRKIANKQPVNIFYAAISVPCFEYWLLLHFEYTTKPFHRTGKSSVADEVIKYLKKYMPKYSKADCNVFCQLVEQLDFAKVNSRRSLEFAKQNHTDNPSTKIHELVDYLQSLISD
ncbi:MAG: RloB family protein [Vibrio sp.]